jgi:signal transduction histidine kinase
MTVNLLSNAVKFTPAGGPITLTASVRDDGGVSIEVRDGGIGIAKADIPKVLSAFGQIDGELSRKHDGTGLGLPIVTSLMELHGGHFALDSELGKGTTACLMFPAERSLRGVGQSVAAR